jgi:hypothetical protein
LYHVETTLEQAFFASEHQALHIIVVGMFITSGENTLVKENKEAFCKCFTTKVKLTLININNF